MTTPTPWMTAKLFGPGLTLNATKQLGTPEIKPLPDEYKDIWNESTPNVPTQ